MAVKKSKPITKSAAIEKTLDSSITNLNNALNQAEKAIKLRQAESKKLLNESRKFKKRRLTQIGKKKRAAAAVKKNANATTNKALRTLTAELNATKKALDKAHTLRQVVLSELSGLKASHKKLVGYIKGIQATDKLIARPKKKKRAKKKVITFVAPDPMPVAPDPMPVAPDPMPVAPDPMPVASDTTPDASDTTPDASDTMPDASDTMPDAS